MFIFEQKFGHGSALNGILFELRSNE